MEHVDHLDRQLGPVGSATPARDAGDADDGSVEPGADAVAAAAPGAADDGPTTTDAEAVEERGTSEVDDDGGAANEGGWSAPEVAVVALVAVIAAALGYAIARVTARRTGPAGITEPARAGATPAPPSPAPIAPVPVGPVVVADEHRNELVAALIDARDRVGSSGVGDRIVAALHAAGVETVDPTGDRFDPEAHVAAGQDRLTDDPALDGRVADVVSYGYRDRGRLLRLPSVVVWRARYVPDGARSEVLR